MPTTNLDQRVKRIADLDQTDIDALNADGASNEDDLRYLDFVDLPAGISKVKRRKLSIIGKYLGSGQQLNATNEKNYKFRAESIGDKDCNHSNPPYLKKSSL